MVQSLPLGNTPVAVPGFGAMGLSSAMGTALDAQQAEPVLQKALDLGYVHWDTAVCLLPSRNSTATDISAGGVRGGP